MNNSALLTMPVTAPPFDHQQKAYEFALGRFGLLDSRVHSAGVGFFFEMGCGKTLTAIGTMGCLYNHNLIRRVLIVCPLSVVGVWADELARFAAFPYSILILNAKLSTRSKIEALRDFKGTGLQITVINYDSVILMPETLRRWAADLIVADEAHKLKNGQAKVSKSMHTLASEARYRLALTGTPIPNKEVDIFSIYKFLNQNVFGASFYRFRSYYFYMTGYGQHEPRLLSSMRDEFARRMHSISYRVTKDECLDLPAITDITQKVELEPKAKKLYKTFSDECAAELERGEITAANILTKILRLSQITGGFVASDDSTVMQSVSTAKLNALSDIIDSSVESGKKVVVIARFTAEINAIADLLQKKKVRYSLVNGATKDRDEQISAFQNDPGVLVFVGQIATVALGVSLTASSTMVFYSLSYNMSDYDQCRARIHRTGQKYPCTYIHLVSPGTVDVRVLRALRNKAELSKSLVDDFRAGSNPFREE
ncbi:MAG: DEAD/DEAH box helicase [Spirochaetales bacterium]|nr:DEAD/DEAH box helicase [Spirochaetales bacterium]